MRKILRTAGDELGLILDFTERHFEATAFFAFFMVEAGLVMALCGGVFN